MWFYCRQKSPKPHCGAGNGMTFSINPHMPGMGDKTQAAFKARAMMQMANSTSAGVSGAQMMQGAVTGTMQETTTTASTTTAANVASSPNPQQASQTPSQLPTPPAPLAQGTGLTNTGSACECSCLCGAAAFPNAMQGLGMMGGISGKLSSFSFVWVRGGEGVDGMRVLTCGVG